MRTIWFLLLPGTHILDLGGPLQIMASLEELRLAPVSVRCIAARQQMSSYQGVTLSGLHPLPEQLSPEDLLFVVGNKLSTSPSDAATLAATAQWLANVMGQTPDVQLCSICTGAFLLGEAGLLNGRECTTHHRYVGLLQARYPKAKVLENRLFVEDDGLFTSAGVSSGTDLALHIVSLHFGKAVANQVAQELVIYRRRAGEDVQLRAADLARNHIHPLVHAAQDYIDTHLGSSFSFEQLASQFNVSYRHLARLFRENTGQTLQDYLRAQRIDLARDLLRGSRLNVEQIAERCGYGSSHAFRLAWRREMPQPPLQFRSVITQENT
ncbi:MULTISPECIES: GlxA family transcriptional regulator [Pseudomonas]|jgi:transcriptional regulator GlxA family with amidase domain|uniref:Helix-turn-helix domain-containing protein n=1 Tax=Pseudomonas juntendi TaxID=2666183 RepID=A0ABD4YB01_9PSED|nr:MULTISPECIES: helix-turn-helix domain-containing protein [Pseudomonas]MBH3373045.1 helix-turn-helix domain-containing protein [Pseudomonas juntendi]MBS6036647.1 helix-turn-helix domain-containing protein [Pseudomonas sp.]MDH0756639.1 helix-turn-helix domain-containing protein [Pseudomonas juntendi]MDH1917498.1 helix-turn-helix domain-containing protein [Pseudomonas juntendi]RRV77906.1 helix-turn-helix domain-containing protein [Pseudomonas sp. p99-361]